jgi:hypothetical protein
VDRVARAAAGAVALLAVLALLGAQGARVGSILVPALSPWWIVAGLGLVLWVTPGREGPLGRGALAASALFLLSLLLLTAWRSRALHPRASLPVLVDGREERLSVSLQIERRNELRRLTGKRRNVSAEIRGALEVPAAGTHEIDIVCDDACEVALGDERLRVEGALRREIELPRGEIPLEIRYRQDSGPARLTLSWDRPGFFEPLPIDYFARAPDGENRSRLSAHLSLAGLALWWALFPFFWMRLARAKSGLRHSVLVPSAAAGLLVLYGSLLRFEAFLAHSDLAGRNGRAARIHESLLPWLPSYGVFNPENAPDDPYRADVRSYLDRAEAMGEEGFYAPSFREPFYVLLVSLFVRIAGGEIGILVESTFFSALTLALFAFVAAKLHGRVWAAALLVPLVLHHWLVLDAPTGYRESAYSFFLLAFVASIAAGGSRIRSSAAAGLLGALLCLIRLSALTIVVPLLAIRLFRLRAGERLGYASVFSLVLLLLVGPFLYSNSRAHGDPFYSVSFHTQFWLRAEGLEGGEGPVSLSRYFTDFERTGALLWGTFLGLTVLPLRTFWNGLAHFPILAVLTLAPGVLGLARCANATLTAAYFGHLAAFAYIQNFPSGEMPRFVMPAFFLLVLAVPGGAALVRSRRRRFRSSRDAAEALDRPSGP